MLLTKNVWIPKGARCCPVHLTDHRFTSNAIDLIKPFSIRYEEWDSSNVQGFIDKVRVFYNEKKHFNFDDPRELSDEEYRPLTSLSRNEFDNLVKEVSSSNMRNACHRTIRTAVGIYLCKLRLGLSNSLLAIMFQLPDKRVVSRVINSARKALVEDFVPYNLGFGHVTRQELIERHTTTIARELMCGGGDDTAIVVIDGTYIYIQVRNI